MFRLLVVEDNPADAQLFRVLAKNFQHPHELYFTVDGIDALDFLHCRGPYTDAPRPYLIVLDMHMPDVDGVEVLSEIRANPELKLIPVIMFSSSGSPQDVRRAYQAHANCYVQKPSNLERAARFVSAIEAFWMDFALLPSCGEIEYSERSVVPHSI